MPEIGNENDIQVPIPYAVSGIGIAVAAGFFVWSNKKQGTLQQSKPELIPKIYAQFR